MKYYLLAMLVLLSAIVYAAEPQYYFKVNDAPKLAVPCFNNNHYCSSNASCSITVMYPNGELFISNQPMTYNTSFFYYNLSGLTQLGDYPSSMACNDTSIYGYSTFSFQVNNAGKKIENLLAIIILFCFLIFISIGLITASTYYKSVMMYPAVLFLSILITILMWILYMSTIALNSIFFALFWVMSVLSVVLFFLVLWEITIAYTTFISKKGREKRDMGDEF